MRGTYSAPPSREQKGEVNEMKELTRWQSFRENFYYWVVNLFTTKQQLATNAFGKVHSAYWLLDDILTPGQAKEAMSDLQDAMCILIEFASAELE